MIVIREMALFIADPVGIFFTTNYL